MLLYTLHPKGTQAMWYYVNKQNLLGLMRTRDVSLVSSMTKGFHYFELESARKFELTCWMCFGHLEYYIMFLIQTANLCYHTTR